MHNSMHAVYGLLTVKDLGGGSPCTLNDLLESINQKHTQMVAVTCVIS